MEAYWNGLHGARKILPPDLVHKPSHMDAEIRNAQGRARLRLSFSTGRLPIYSDWPRRYCQYEPPICRGPSQRLGDGRHSHLALFLLRQWRSEGRFEDSCVSKEVEDLGAVIDVVKAQGRRVAYVGTAWAALRASGPLPMIDRTPRFTGRHGAYG